MPTSRCHRCLLPEAVPGSDFDESRTCRFCREYDESGRDRDERQRRAFREDLEAALRDCRGKGPYDCLVCFSGGKDSIYLLYQLKVEYGLRPLAFTCDLDIPPVGWANIRRCIDRLDIDHITYRPPMGFYKKFFRYLLKNQDPRGAVRSVCYVSAPLTEGYALHCATQRGIPLVLAGYSPGQPEPDWMLYEMSREKIRNHDWTPAVLRDSGLFDDTELSYFWNPQRFPAGTEFPRFLAPYHAWDYNQTEFMNKVTELGLVAARKSANPLQSNSPFQWLLMYSDLLHLGFNPYAPEFCKLIRAGRTSKRFWKLMFPIWDFMIRHRVLQGRYIDQSCKWLDLRLDELRVLPEPADAQERDAEDAERRVAV